MKKIILILVLFERISACTFTVLCQSQPTYACTDNSTPWNGNPCTANLYLSPGDSLQLHFIYLHSDYNCYQSVENIQWVMISIPGTSVVGTHSIVTIKTPGTYYVTFNGNSWTFYSGQINIISTIYAGVPDFFETPEFSIFPNPVSNILSVNIKKLSGKDALISIYDITDKKLSSVPLKSVMEFSIDVSLIPIGIYYVIIEDETRISSRKKLVVLR